MTAPHATTPRAGGPRVVTAEEAVRRIPDGATVVSDGFTMMGVAEEILREIERAYLAEGRPKGLTWVHAAGQANAEGGVEHLAHPGLVATVVGSHWGLAPRMSRLLRSGEVAGVCLPQGQLATLLRSSAAGRPGQLTTTGIGTFVDPRREGGLINEAARAAGRSYVDVLEVDGAEYLYYRALHADVAIIRATRVDAAGNAAMDGEAVALDALAAASLVRNRGGTVLCQAAEQVPLGTIPARDVVVPGALIDYVVPTTDREAAHRQTHRAAFEPAFLGGVSGQTTGELADPGQLGDDARAQIGRLAIREVRPGAVLNVGTGIPGDTVGRALHEVGLLDEVHLTMESGVWGGVSAGGLDFGIAYGPRAILPHAQQFDFYHGGGVDVTFMGAGQIDPAGNVNVSKLGDRLIGCGGFIDIVQAAKAVVFCFSVGGGRPKLVPEVDQVTFAAGPAVAAGQRVRYVCELGVFDLDAEGLVLTELSTEASVAQLRELTGLPLRVSPELTRFAPLTGPTGPTPTPTPPREDVA